MTPMENINLHIDVYLNLMLLENFRLSSLRFVSCFRHVFCLVLGFGLFWCYHELSISQAEGTLNPKAGVMENKEGVKQYQG